MEQIFVVFPVKKGSRKDEKGKEVVLDVPPEIIRNILFFLVSEKKLYGSETWSLN